MPREGVYIATSHKGFGSKERKQDSNVLDFTSGKMVNSYPKDAAKRSSMNVNYTTDEIPDDASTDADV